MKKKIYIAGPYTSDPEANIEKAISVAEELWRLNYNPYIPHLVHYWHKIFPKSWHEWLEYDREWLSCCDAVLRINGDSKGADIEVKWAEEKEIPVYYSLEELLNNHNGDSIMSTNVSKMSTT